MAAVVALIGSQFSDPPKHPSHQILFPARRHSPNPSPLHQHREDKIMPCNTKMMRPCQASCGSYIIVSSMMMIMVMMRKEGLNFEP